MQLTTLTLGEICDQGGGIIRTGPFGSQLHESDYSDIGIPVVMPKDIIEGKVSEASIARVSQEHVGRLAQHRLLPGDIVYGRRGDIGRQALITARESGWLCGTGCLRITPGDAPVDSTWLHYYLREEKVIEFIAQQAVGATMPNLNTSILRSIPITFPDKTEQRRIASILSAYDDLIENNTRRIAILEEMARRIYEEWFVRFRFPGHKKMRMVETELGVVPEGWQSVRIGDYCDVTDYVANGSFASLKENVTYRNEPDYAILVRTKDFGSGWGGDYVYVTEASYRFLKKSGLSAGDIVVGNVGNAGMTFRVPELGQPMTLGPNAITVRPKANRAYLFQYLCGDIGQHLMRGIVSGAAQPKFNKTEFRKLPLPLPPDTLLGRYEEIGDTYWKLSETIRKKNANLRTTRDLLLPKLISGELDVSHLPEPEAMAA